MHRRLPMSTTHPWGLAPSLSSLVRLLLLVTQGSRGVLATGSAEMLTGPASEVGWFAPVRSSRKPSIVLPGTRSKQRARTLRS